MDFKQLQPDLILDAAEAFGFEVSGQYYPLNSYENRVYQVGIEPRGQLIAKFYRPDHWCEAQIIEEHEFTKFLASKGVKVVNTLCSQTGSSLLEVEGFYASVQEKIIGPVPELEDLDSLYQLGQLIGKMHQASRDWQFKKRQQLSVTRMGRDNVKYLLNGWVGKKQQLIYQSIATELLAAIDKCLPENFEQHFIAVHGDCHLANVVMSEEGPVLLDFDDAMMAPAIQDIWMFLAGENNRHQLAELIDGYEESLDFPRNQLLWIPALRALRVINYTAWLAKRWGDPAFPTAFPWFNTEDFWIQHCQELQALTSQIVTGDETFNQVF